MDDEPRFELDVGSWGRGLSASEERPVLLDMYAVAKRPFRLQKGGRLIVRGDGSVEFVEASSRDPVETLESDGPIVMTRILIAAPWINTTLTLRASEDHLVLIVPGWKRRAVREALRAAGRQIVERRSLVSYRIRG